MAPQADGTDEERRDHQLQEITVGALKPHNAPITLAPYDPTGLGCSAARPTACARCSATRRCASSTSGRPRSPV